MVVWGGLALWLREGYEGRLLFWYGGRFNSIRGMVDLLWPEVGLLVIGLMVPVLCNHVYYTLWFHNVRN